MDLVTFGLLSLVVVLLYLYFRHNDSFNSMPGPFRLPVFGNLQFNFPKLHLQFTEFAKKFGDIYRIQILSQPAIVINSYEAFKAAYIKRGKDFIGRPHMFRFEVIGATSGVAFRDYSEKQTQLRTQALKILKMFGLSHLDTLVNENIKDLIELFKAQNGQSFDPKTPIKKFLINIIMTMVFGHKADYDDPILEDICEFNAAAVESATIGREDLDVWTWTKSLNPNYKLAKRAKELADKTLKPLYVQYKNTYVEGHERGAIDQYISEVMVGNITDEDVIGCLIDYFIGGVETTATTLHGFLLILLNSPKIQQRLQYDIDDVIGRDRSPQVSDKRLLPYVQACVYELLRYQSVLPILIPRQTVRDTELAGYRVPKGTWVYTNAWAIHHNPQVYPEPFKYKPERFLNADGELLSQDHDVRKHLVTFGGGGRHCIGESLAKTRLFLTLCNLMQNFTFEYDEHSEVVSDDARNYNLKIVFDITRYTLKAMPRSQSSTC